jgi:protoporphyrinogen/coproporphyrinogen III oxidase
MGETTADVAVVGAGAAGLSAAWRLVERGIGVVLYESDARVGGRLRTDESDGIRVDVAAQLLGAHFTETVALVRAVGAESLLAAASGRDALWRGGRARLLRYGSVASMATSDAIPTALKLRLLARYLPFLGRYGDALDPAEPARGAGAELDGESIATWGRRVLGDDFVELMVYPALAAYANMLPEETSAGYYHALAAAGLNLRLLAVRGGMGALAEAVAAAVRRRGEVRLERGVEGLEIAEDRVAVLFAGGIAREHAGVVLATPAAESARLLAGQPVERWLTGVETRPALSVTLLLDRPPALDCFGLTVPRREAPGDMIAAVCDLSAKPAGLVPAGLGALVVYPAPARVQELSGLTPEAVVERLLPAVTRLLPRVADTVTRARVQVLPGGSTQMPPGALRRLREGPAELPRRLALAGDYLVAPTVEGAVRSGTRAADRILAVLAAN